MKCGECKWFNALAYKGECRRRAPQTQTVDVGHHEYASSSAKSRPNLQTITNWPRVKKHDYCGEFEQKPRESVESTE